MGDFSLKTGITLEKQVKSLLILKGDSNETNKNHALSGYEKRPGGEGGSFC